MDGQRSQELIQVHKRYWENGNNLYQDGYILNEVEVEQIITVIGRSFVNIYFMKMSEEIIFQKTLIENVQ